jgi:hypothetical protein
LERPLKGAFISVALAFVNEMLMVSLIEASSLGK